jgi:hypothetical protein
MLFHGPKGQENIAQAGLCMCLASVIRPEGSAPKGQESLAQGLSWVSRNKRFALKGLEMRTRSGAKVRSRFPPCLVAPSGLIRMGGITQGKPWAMLSWPFGPWRYSYPLGVLNRHGGNPKFSSVTAATPDFFLAE